MTKRLLINDYVLIINMINENNYYSFSAELIKDNKLIDKETTFNITNNYNTAIKIFNILCEEKVFPAHLHYIIDEL